MSCINPIRIRSPYRRDDDNKFIYVGCGRCAWCRKEKRDEWFIRFKLESHDNEFTKFITLTYDDEHLPFFLDEETGECGYYGNKEDCQKFFKRLRKRGFKFKYFLVSELGGDTERLHYHALLWTDDNISNDDIREAWQKGSVTDCQDANDAQMKYVVKYILKGQDRVGQIKLQSTRPAIGSGYIKKQNALNSYYYNEENKTWSFLFPLNGMPHKMPRYFQKKFAQFFDEDDFISNKMAVIRNMEQNGKFHHLEKVYGKVKDEGLSPLEDQEKFLTSLRVKYNRDNNSQYEINNKKFNKYE